MLKTKAQGPFTTRRLDSPTAQTLAKGLRVLGLFDASHREWSLDQIVEAAGLPKTTAHRLARTLSDFRYLVFDPAANKYHLGPAMLAGLYLSARFSDLVRVAHPYLEALAQESEESVVLAVEVDGVAVAADMIETSRPFRRRTAIGRIIGELANSSGKIIYADKPIEELRRVLASPLPRYTPFTITDPEQMIQELERVRRDGVAFDMQELDLGVCAVSAGVRDQAGTLVASISVVVPAGRFDDEKREVHAAAVRSTCLALSAFLGYSAGSDAAGDSSTTSQGPAIGAAKGGPA